MFKGTLRNLKGSGLPKTWETIWRSLLAAGTWILSSQRRGIVHSSHFLNQKYVCSLFPKKLGINTIHNRAVEPLSQNSRRGIIMHFNNCFLSSNLTLRCSNVLFFISHYLSTNLLADFKIENRRKFFEEYAKANKFDPLVAENWHSQSLNSILTTKVHITKYKKKWYLLFIRVLEELCHIINSVSQELWWIYFQILGLFVQNLG